MSWKARLLMGLMLVAMLMAIAGPAMADHTFEVEEFEVDEFFFPLVSEVDVDVDVENVGPRNDNEGECIVTEVDWDLDGFIAEWEIEITCFV